MLHGRSLRFLEPCCLNFPCFIKSFVCKQRCSMQKICVSSMKLEKTKFCMAPKDLTTKFFGTARQNFSAKLVIPSFFTTNFQKPLFKHQGATAMFFSIAYKKYRRNILISHFHGAGRNRCFQ